ncbi:hypothetical protein QR46_0592 [Giardia duodenalis assemblage B]|uniref:Uncharacterized protein n=3 Tax=Giardia intestinalis TaxID=5741 RepID=A0A132P095_GIAIN|nr:Hypothetical protein GL50581_3545 [Giardia intestinalis ATCC 50581]ESU44877.1 Hypothetical protein GSB_4692 [Giardia intestinalis]KWX15392.1 hypothetical protein QR46_0592 [Giardia intestinalis assemblage B]
MRQATGYIRSTYSGRPRHASDCPVYAAGVCTCAADVECPPGWKKPEPVDCKSFSRPVRPLLAHTSTPPDCNNPSPDRYFKYPVPGESCEAHVYGPDSTGCVGLLKGDPYTIPTKICCIQSHEAYQRPSSTVYRCEDLHTTVTPATRLCHWPGRISNFRLNQETPGTRGRTTMDVTPRKDQLFSPFDDGFSLCPYSKPQHPVQKYAVSTKWEDGITCYECGDPSDARYLKNELIERITKE